MLNEKPTSSQISLKRCLRNLQTVRSCNDVKNSISYLRKRLLLIIRACQSKYRSRLQESLTKIEEFCTKLNSEAKRVKQNNPSDDNSPPGLPHTMKPDPDAADVNTLPAPIQVKIEPTGYKTPQSQFVKAESIKSPSMTKMKFKIPKKNSIQASQTQCSRMRATSRSSQNPSPLRPLLEKKKGPSSRLIEAMKCTNCERFLTPHRAYKCITGHFFCHICKGTNKFGPECQKCFIMYEIHRKIRPCPALVETHSDLKKCLQYIETCPDCKNLYYKFDKDGHISCKRQ